MSNSDSSPENDLSTLSPIRATISEFRSDFTNLERLVDGLFDEIERLSRELEGKASDLNTERERAVERELQLSAQRQETERIAHQYADQESQLTEMMGTMRDLKSLVEQQAEEAQRRAEEAAKLHDRLAATEAASIDTATAARLSELEKERDSLEHELDTARSRNAELNELIAQQKDELSEHQTETASELKRLGSLVEERFERITQLTGSGDAPASDDGNGQSSNADENGDPVVSSVVAQLSKLQRDVTRRNRSGG